MHFLEKRKDKIDLKRNLSIVHIWWNATFRSMTEGWLLEHEDCISMKKYKVHVDALIGKKCRQKRSGVPPISSVVTWFELFRLRALIEAHLKKKLRHIPSRLSQTSVLFAFNQYHLDCQAGQWPHGGAIENIKISSITNMWNIATGEMSQAIAQSNWPCLQLNTPATPDTRLMEQTQNKYKKAGNLIFLHLRWEVVP